MHGYNCMGKEGRMSLNYNLREDIVWAATRCPPLWWQGGVLCEAACGVTLLSKAEGLVIL